MQVQDAYHQNGMFWNGAAWIPDPALAAPPPAPPAPPAPTPPPAPPAGYAPPQAPAAPAPAAPGAVTQPGRFRTGESRFSHFYVLSRDEKGVQRTAILIPKTDHATVAAMMEAERQAVAKQWPQNPPQYYRKPYKDGDTHKSATTGKPIGEECKGFWVINARAYENSPCQVMDEYGNYITAPYAVVSGDWGFASITFYAKADDPANIGVNACLNSIVFVRKGIPLGGSAPISAEAEFADKMKQAPAGYVVPGAGWTPAPALPGPTPSAPPQGRAGTPVGGFAPPPSAPPGYAPPAPPVAQPMVFNPTTNAWEVPGAMPPPPPAPPAPPVPSGPPPGAVVQNGHWWNAAANVWVPL